MLHLRNEAWQRRLGRRGGEDEQELTGQVLQQQEDVEPGDDLEQTAEDDDDEQRAGEVEGAHEGRHRPDRGPAGLADDRSDRTEGADGSGPHDHYHELEDDGLDVLDSGENRLAGLAHRLQGESDEESEHEGRQNRDVTGDEAHEEGDHSAFFATGGLFIGLEVESVAGVDEVADDEADDQGERRHDEEVDEREPADLADGGCLRHGADAEDDGAEDDRGDDHLDECDECLAQRFESDSRLRGDESDGGTGEHGHDDHDVEPVSAILLPLRGALIGGRCGGFARVRGPAFLLWRRCHVSSK